MKLKIFIFLVSLLFIWIVISVIWYYSPGSFLNVKHNITSELTIDKIKGPVLILATHKDNFNDLLFVCGESRKSKTKINIAAAKLTFSITQVLQGLPLFTSYNRIIIAEKRVQTGTVKKCVDLINDNQSVLILLDEGNNRTGFYNILKQTNVPIVFCRMTRENYDLTQAKPGGVLGTFGSKLNIEYELYDNYDITIEKETFISHINNKLYNIED